MMFTILANSNDLSFVVPPPLSGYVVGFLLLLLLVLLLLLLLLWLLLLAVASPAVVRSLELTIDARRYANRHVPTESLQSVRRTGD